MDPLFARHVLVRVDAGIDAYRALPLIRTLRALGAHPAVLPSPRALRYIQPLAFAHAAGLVTVEDVLPSRPDLGVFFPADLDALRSLAAALDEDPLYRMTRAAGCPLLVEALLSPAERRAPELSSIWSVLAARGIQLHASPAQPPGAGPASARAAPIDDDAASLRSFLEACRALLCEPDLAGMHVLVTAGPTREDIDPARYLTNRSSGKMGIALATLALRRGARVTLVHGPLEVPLPSGERLQTVAVRSAREMYDAVFHALDHDTVHAAILCAAVSDYRPASLATRKIKKDAGGMDSIALVENPDILAAIGARRERPVLMGFAAETDLVEAHAQRKLLRKRADFIAANDVSQPGVGFGADQNQVTVFARQGEPVLIPLGSKEEVADQLLDVIWRATQERATAR